jgi:hypothetical protein
MNIAPIRATQHTVPAALNSFISLVFPFGPSLVSLRLAPFGVMQTPASPTRDAFEGISGAVLAGSWFDR